MIENKRQQLKDALIAGEKSGFVDYKLEDIISDLNNEYKRGSQYAKQHSCY
jgi:hypothetical protein